MRMLTLYIHQFFSGNTQLLQGRGVPVDETAGTPAGIHRPAQQAYMLVIPGIFKSVFTHPFRHVRQIADVKFRAYFRALATMANHTCIAALAEYKGKRID